MEKNDSTRKNRGRSLARYRKKQVPSATSKEELFPPEPQSEQPAQLPEPVFSEQFSATDELQADDGPLSNFANLLTHILKRDRAEIAHIAQELDVAEHTVYRWMNGTSRPRSIHFKKLLEALPEQNDNLVYAINQTFPGALDSFTTGVRDIQKEIYTRVMDIYATTTDEETRSWQIIQSIFEYALLHLDAERQGLSLSFARLMPAHEDGIHSLYESATRGNYPWPHMFETQCYLGSNTLAGAAALSQRWQSWDDLDEAERLRYMVDQFEKSGCAYPVLLGGRVGGVLRMASTRPGFFSDMQAHHAVVEYARLLALAIPQDELRPTTELNLRPMPSVDWQREVIRRTFLNRVIAYARRHNCSSFDAKNHVLRDLELEFEERTRTLLEQGQHTSSVLR